jgi:hypothetical protein
LNFDAVFNVDEKQQKVEGGYEWEQHKWEPEHDTTNWTAVSSWSVMHSDRQGAV